MGETGSKEIGCECLDLIQLYQGRPQWRSLTITVMNIWIYKRLVNFFTNRQLQKKDYSKGQLLCMYTFLSIYCKLLCKSHICHGCDHLKNDVLLI
jgi:hypothetical protein